MPRIRHPGLSASFTLLAEPAYRLLWIGQTVSSAGDALVRVTLVFAILHVGGTAADIGYVAAIQAVTQLFFVLAGGVWADRLRRQAVMLVSDGLRAAVQAGLAVVLIAGDAHIWELGLGAAIYGAAQSFFGPAAAGLVPQTVPPAQLQRANALMGLSGSFLRVSGPATAGVLVAAFGPGLVFAVDAATFVASAVCLGLLQVAPRTWPERSPFYRDLAAGWHQVKIRPWYWLNLCGHALWNLAIPAYVVLGPLIAARELGGASAWGAISASWAAGSIGGGVAALHLRPRRPLVAANLALVLGALPLLALTPPLATWEIGLAAALGGVGLTFMNEVWAATMQELIPDQVLSRVSSYESLISLVVMPAGFAVVGPLASTAGDAPTLIGAAIVVGVVCPLVAAIPAVRAVRRTAAGQLAGGAPAGPDARPAAIEPESR